MSDDTRQSLTDVKTLSQEAITATTNNSPMDVVEQEDNITTTNNNNANTKRFF